MQRGNRKYAYSARPLRIHTVYTRNSIEPAYSNSNSSSRGSGGPGLINKHRVPDCYSVKIQCKHTDANNVLRGVCSPCATHNDDSDHNISGGEICSSTKGFRLLSPFMPFTHYSVCFLHITSFIIHPRFVVWGRNLAFYPIYVLITDAMITRRFI